jgi:ketosteroid isomerase-like protein
MSEQDNLRTVQLSSKALLKGDLPSLLKLCTDDLEILPAPSTIVPWARPWQGLKQAEQYFMKLAEAIEFQEYEMDEFIVGKDSVVVLGHERCLVRASGRVVEVKWVQIFDFRDGLIRRHREYTDTAAWDAGFQTA